MYCFVHFTKFSFLFLKSYKNGWTALFFAADKGHVECLRALLSAGADIHVQAKVSILIFPNVSSSTNYYNNTINSHNTIIKITRTLILLSVYYCSKYDIFVSISKLKIHILC